MPRDWAQEQFDAMNAAEPLPGERVEGVGLIPDPREWDGTFPDEHDEPEHATLAEHLADDTRPATPVAVVVVGSFHWDSEATVYGALAAWWEGAGSPPVVLYTSGCPHGAEAQAVAWATHEGWSIQALRDEELVQVPGIAFAFIKDGSAGASALADELGRRTWLRRFADDTVRQTSPWADR